MPAFFAVIGSIASTTRKFETTLECKQYGILSLNWKKLEIRVDDLKITLFFQKERFLLIPFFKLILESNDNLPRNGKTITKSFFSAVNVTGVFSQLLMRSFLIFLLNDILPNEILENPRQLKTLKTIK